MLKTLIMLEAQRERAHLRGRLVATGLDEDEARAIANQDVREFQPAFVQGRRRQVPDERFRLSLGHALGRAASRLLK